MTQPTALNRRTALKNFVTAGAVGAAGTLVTACAPSADASWSFTHGVASGDPTQTAVVIWTRVADTKAENQTPITGTWEIAEDESFTRIIKSGAFATGPERDYTVKVDVMDLPPGRRLAYRFKAGTKVSPGRRLAYRFKAGTKVSPAGRTLTLPMAGDTTAAAQKLCIALFSCSNYAFGYFNAYKHCAAREDIDIAMHVGDYIYEYGAGKYGADRQLLPEHEVVTLQDYRIRHGHYRSDPDLQEIHRRLPFIVVWDDHEFANDAWTGGAENHHKNEGSWADRRAAAMRAYFEWMPLRPLSPDQGGRTYRSFNYGDLASIIMLDTRIYGRDKQLQYEVDVPMSETAEAVPAEAGVFKPVQQGANQGIPAFRRDWDRFRAVLNDPKRSILGQEQEAWLNEEFQRSYLQGAKWRILGQQTLLGLLSPPDPEPLLRGVSLTDDQRQEVGMLAELARENMPLFLDSFGGSYRAARSRLLDAASATGGNTVILTGDSHNAWAFNLRDSNGAIAAVEVGGTSVTSPGIEAELPMDPIAGEKALVEKNPELSYCKLNARGYAVVGVEADAVTVEWIYIDTVKTRNSTASLGKRLRIARTAGGGTQAFASA